MKIKTVFDSVLAAIFLIVASCATQTPQVESPAGKYEIHEKDTRGMTVAVYNTTKFTETMDRAGMVVNFIDSRGKPRSFKSYDIFKL